MDTTPPMTFRSAAGLALPALSLGLWQNFGATTAYADQRALVHHALERGITHLDLANNYGPPPGAAEESVGRMLRELPRDELVIATKAGYRGWEGPYGEGGSRASLLKSLDASLRRLGLDHVDIFYSHRFDPTTPLQETIGALATALATGRARYVGISSYSARRTREAAQAAADLGIPLLATQVSSSMINRWITVPDDTGDSLLDTAAKLGMGVLAFSPLAQGMLTERYLDGIPPDSRAARGGSLRAEYLSSENLAHVRRLAKLAADRGQPLAQCAIGWALNDPRVTSVVVGARTPDQLDGLLGALDAAPFTPEELAVVESVPADSGVNLWGVRSSDL